MEIWKIKFVVIQGGLEFSGVQQQQQQQRKSAATAAAAAAARQASDMSYQCPPCTGDYFNHGPYGTI